jgi:uncharacterized protein YbcI
MTGEETTGPPHEQPGEVLTGRDWSGQEPQDERGSMRAELSNAMVGLKKGFYGKGPTKAKTYFNDNYVLCVLEGGLTRNEETLLAAGEEHLVRSFRLRFQEVMAEPTCEAVEEITGRKVLGYHSQIVFDPERAFEIFVLDGSPAGQDQPPEPQS